MHCHVCNVAVGEGQQFCHECGVSLKGVTDRTEPIPAVDTALTASSLEHDAAASGPSTVTAVHDSTGSMDAVPALDRTTQMPQMDAPPATTGDITDRMAQVDGRGGLFDGGADITTYPVVETRGFRLRASLVFALLALPTTLMAGVADIVEVRTSRPVDGIAVGLRTIEDFGSNMAVAGIVGAAAMLLGSLLSCFGSRWGAGLAGGSGLAVVGWAAIALGLVEVPISAAQRVTNTAGADVNGFTLFITRDLGWFLLVAVAALGLVVFVASLRMASTGGRPGLNPWIAALGALAVTILAAGPLIPLGNAVLGDNLRADSVPREFLASRLIQLGLIAAAGIVGFLSVRTYGLGLAAGGISVATWQWATSLIDDADFPDLQAIGIAVGNFGTNSTTPHAVTTVAMAASLVMVAVAATLAVVTRPRS